MPTYSYACKNCGHQFDIHQSFSDNALTDCPECGGQLRKVFNSVGVVFKGSGFYRTDSRDKSSSSGSSSSSSTPAAKSDTSTDSSTSDAAPKADAKPKADTSATASASSASPASD